MARLFDDGSSEYLENATAVVTAYPCTMAGWFYTDLNSANQVICAVVYSANEGDWTFLSADGGSGGDPVTARVASGGDDEIAASSSGYSVNTWHHAIGVFNNATDRRAYIDGGSEGSNSNSTAFPGSLDKTSIGRLSRNTPYAYMSGRIGEVAIWGVALSAGQRLVLAAGYSPLFVSPQNLVAYWPLVRSDNDIVGGYAMTAYNTPTFIDHPPIIHPSALSRKENIFMTKLIHLIPVLGFASFMVPMFLKNPKLSRRQFMNLFNWHRK